MTAGAPPRRPLLLLASAALFGASDRAAGEDWPRWRGPQGTGVSSEKHWVSVSRGELFRVEIGLGYSSPSIAAGRLFTLGFDQETAEDVILCLDARRGEALWTHRYASKLWNNMHEGGTLTTPTVHEGRVYVLSRVGPLMCLDADDGELLWSRNLTRELGVETEPFGLNTSPVVVEGMVIVNAGRAAAFDPEDGELYWETGDYGYSYGTPMPFLRKGEPCLAVFNGAGLAILDALEGEELLLYPWTSKFNVNCATPIVQGEKVFISTGYDDKGCAMLGVGGDSVEVFWESKAMRNRMSGCVLVEDHLYGFDATLLKCIDTDGEKQWVERGLGSGALSAAGDRLLVLSEKGELLVCTASPEGFEALSRTPLFEEGVCWAPPVLCDGLVYSRNNKGTLVCTDHRPAPQDSRKR